MNARLFFLMCASVIWTQTHAQQLHLSHTRFIGGQLQDGVGSINSAANNSFIFTGATTSGTAGIQDGDIPGNWTDSNGNALNNLVVGMLDSNLQISWIKVYGGSKEDGGGRVIQTADGGFAVFGGTSSNDLDVSGSHSPGTPEFWLVKLDAQGNKIWQHCYGGPAADIGASFIQTADHGFLLLGLTNGSGGDVPSVYVNSQFTEDWLLVKTDSLGAVQWSKTVGGTGDEGNAILLAANDGYYIAGTSSSTDHECLDTSNHSTVLTGADYVVVRLDTAGNQLWSKHYGGVGSETVGDAIWDPRDSSIVIVGSSSSPGGNPQNTNNSYDELVIRIDKNGAYKWGAKVGDNSDETLNMGVTRSSDGGYVTVCQTEPDSPLPAGHIGTYDFWLYKFDSSGHVVSNKIMGGNSLEYTGSGIVPSHNGFCVIGSTSSDQFSEGNMLNVKHGTYPDIFVSEIEFWPLAVANIFPQCFNLQLYPNPAQNGFTAALPDKHHKGILQVYDISGKLIYSGIVQQNIDQIYIDVRNWSRGDFVIEWVPKDGQTIKGKIVLN